MNKNNNILFENAPLHIIFIGLIIFVMLGFFHIQSNYLTSIGNLEGAAFVGSAAATFLVMVSATFFAIAFAKLGLYPRIASIFTDSKSISIKQVNLTGAYSFILGIVLWTLISASSALSSITITVQSSIFGSAAAAMPLFEEKFLLTIAAPLAEETAFTLGLPLVLFALFYTILKQFDINPENSKALQFVLLVIIVAVSSITFAYFHVANISVIGFIIAAIIFRSIMITTTWADALFDAIPLATITFGFALGAHIANNVMATGGWIDFLQVMLFGGTNLFIILMGWFIVFGYFGSQFAIVIYDLIKRVFG